MASFIPTAAMAALQMGVEAAQRRQKADVAQASREAQARYRIAQIERANQIESQQRRKALKKALATQRARFGAQGVGLSGSADAVLRGLAADAAEHERQARDLTRLRTGQIESQTAWAGRRNLLEASQPTYRAALNLAQKGVRQIPLFDF